MLGHGLLPEEHQHNLVQRVTWDATPEAGAAEGCADNTCRTFDVVFEKGKSDDGRAELQQAFQLCDPLEGEEDVTALAYWIQVRGQLAVGCTFLCN